jgi:hypothetical protein
MQCKCSTTANEQLGNKLAIITAKLNIKHINKSHKN